MSQPFRSTNFLPRLQINGHFTHCIHRSFYLCVYFFRFVSRLQRLIRIIFVSYIWKMRSVLPNQCLLVPWLCVTCISHIDCSAYFFTFICFLFLSTLDDRKLMCCCLLCFFSRIDFAIIVHADTMSFVLQNVWGRNSYYLQLVNLREKNDENWIVNECVFLLNERRNKINCIFGKIN